MYPRLRENVWRIDPRKPSAVLMTPDETYAVPTMPALEFLKMRSYCTGHHPVGTIAQKSGLAVADVNALLAALEPAGVVLPPDCGDAELTAEHVRERFTKLADLWRAELQIMSIGNDFAAGRLPKIALIGWLLESYHYVHDLPNAIEHGAVRATGELHDVLASYAMRVRGHQAFVLATLENLGISHIEAQSSTPLPSTRLIGFLMRELFALAPWSALPVTAITAGQAFDVRQVQAFKTQLHERYGVASDAFDPYFQLQQNERSMHYAELLATHRHLIELSTRKTLDQVTNTMHDLLHSFDLQGMEIKAYYRSLNGKYVPRQPVTFGSI